MAPVALNVSPGLRPWRQAGITHLLLDAALAEALRAAGQPSPAGARAGKTPPRPKSGRPVPPPQPDPVSAKPTGPTGPIWPEAWQSLWVQASAIAKQPAVVWTYAELGTDLRGQADAGRRQILRTLLAELDLPKGSHAFWPYCLPPGNAPEPEMFLAGLNRFRPGLVLLAGGQAAADLAGIGTLPAVNFQIVSCLGLRFVLLPGLAEMAGMAGSRREQLLDFIRRCI